MRKRLDLSYLWERLRFSFRALESRNFRLFFFAGLVSLMGTWIQNLALGWLVYRLTNSAFYLGLVGFAGQIPGLFLTPFAGVFADRLDRHAILRITQTALMIASFLMAFLIFTDKISVSLILVVVVINGVAIAFDTPFRHAFLLDMIGDKRLIPNAVALNSTNVNTARFLGPGIGGVLVALYGEALCFLINGFSFMAMLIALMLMRVPKRVVKKKETSLWQELSEGFVFTWNFKPARSMIMLVIITAMFGLPVQQFLPAFARDILKGESQLLGFLTGALGAGALTGALYLATRESMKALPAVIRFSAFTFAVGLFVFSWSNWPAFSIIVLYFTGFGMITQFSATNTLLQTVVDEDMRGRVLSFYSMSFVGFTPVGSLILGYVADKAGVSLTFSIAAVILFAAAMLYSKSLAGIRESLKLS